MATGIRKTGDFCWINVLTPQPAGAMEFFAGVLGWTYFEMPGIGHGIRAGGKNIGGLFDLEGPNTPPGCTADIGLMVKIDDADAVREKVMALGGTARPAFDIGDQGRMAVCSDPNGGKFDVWEPRQMPGTDADSALHGVPSWFEALTTDVERATGFYAGLFGWTPEVRHLPALEYTVFKNHGSEIAGMMSAAPELVGLEPLWTTYCTVDDADEAARVAVRLGGRLHVPLMDIPDIGRFCGITSPQGVRLAAIQYLPRQGS
jgi:predicted enzyme related to lactoylglutathione lyase